MPKEWIDVADTAVKIGLGSLITGVFTYLGVKFNNKAETNKFKLEHKTKLVEQMSSDTEDYFSAWNSLISPVSAAAKKLPYDQDIKEYPKENQKVISQRDDLLRDSWVKKHAVIAKIRLLKADKALEKFRVCSDTEKELRDALWFDNKCLNYKEVTQYRVKAIQAQREFSEELANFYEAM